MPQPADYIIENARVWTGDPQAAGSRGRGRARPSIAYVGTTADARGWRGPTTRLIDAQGCTLTLRASSIRIFTCYTADLNLGRAHLFGLRTADAIIAELRAFAAAHPDEPWVQGRGAAYDVINGRADLDAAVPDRPVLVIAYDGHTAWVNTRALELAGILTGGAVRGPQQRHRP